MNNKTRILVVILIIIVILCGGIIAYKFYRDKSQNVASNDEEPQNTVEEPPLEVEIKTVQTFKGDERPIAVMIDNHKAALPQGGLNNAYMVYEIIVEGGESRLMALFKGQNLEKIGPVRSSRHYFLDYALENDAIYVHYGWSPQAQYDISNLGVNNINGISESESSFWRVKDKRAPHNVATSTAKILSIAERKGYKTTSTKESVLNYVTDEVEQSQYINMFKNEGIDAVILTHNIDQPFITNMESKNENLKFKRIDADLSDSFKEETSKDELKDMTEKLSKTFKDALGKENLTVNVEKLKDASISSMITLSEESRRMQDMMKMYGMAGMDPNMFGAEGQTLVLNANNDLVKYVAEHTDGENTKIICEQLYDLAMLSHAPLSPEQMTGFIARSNKIMELLAK